jgi:hypothetical protein
MALALTLAGTQETDGARVAAIGVPGVGPLVQRAARARLEALQASLPRAPYVNAGGALPIAIQIANVGEANLAVCRVRIHAEGAAPTDTLLEASIAGGHTVTMVTLLRAAATPGALLLDATLEAAIDSNDPSRQDAWMEPRAAHLELLAERPGELQAQVEPGQTRVSAGQATPWWISVQLDNPGDEPLRLHSPGADDLVFRRDGAGQADYIVVPPDSFEEGGLVLEGGRRGTLRYRIARTGEIGGAITVDARITATHDNDPGAAAATAIANAVFEVDAEPGLRILSTDSVTWRRQHGYDDFRVRIGQPFVVRAVVENTGGTWLDSILVQVDSQRGNSTIEAGLLASLGPGLRGAIDLQAVTGTWLSQPGLPETFTTYVHSARDRNSGLPVLAGAAVDNVSLAYVESAAQLVLEAWIDSPEGARDGELSAGQEFVLAARVDNRGSAEVSASGRLGIAMPPGYSLAAGDSEAFFSPGEIVRWTLQAPDDVVASPESLLVRITAVPLDLDAGEPAVVLRDQASVGVRVRETGVLACSLALVGPAGAADGTVSTGQLLELELHVQGDPELEAREATLVLPAGWRDASGEISKRDLPSDPEVRLGWPVIAGDIPGDLPVVLRVVARDRNDGTQRVATDTVQVRVERATRLALSAAIVAPAEASGGRLVPGQRFRLRARVRNHGQAAVTSGTLRLAELPLGYVANAFEQPLVFLPDGSAWLDWEVQCPASPRPGVESIRVACGTMPLDANTGAPAGFDADSTTARLAVSLVDDGVQLETIPMSLRLAAPGERRVPLLMLEIANQGAADVRVDSLGLWQTDGGTPLEVAWISAVHLVREDAPAETLAVSVSAAPLAWLVLPDAPALRLAAGTSARWELLADLVPGASPAAFAVALRAPQVPVPLVRCAQAGSGTPVPVRAAPRSALVSDPLRVLAPTLQAYNAPNPFHVGRETTTIRYQLEQSAMVEVRIATLTGELVWEARRQEETGGPALRALQWDGRNGAGQPVRNGVYVCHVQVGARTSRFKIAVVR